MDDFKDSECSKCPIQSDTCPVLEAQIRFNIDQWEKGEEKLLSCLKVFITGENQCRVRMSALDEGVLRREINKARRSFKK